MRRFLFILLILHAAASGAQTISVPFSAPWQFSRFGQHDWFKAEVPGTVHTDLLKNQLIPDPFYRDGEKMVQWVEQEDWEYRSRFDAPGTVFSKRHIWLVFDGLDTHADVYLNGRLLLRTDNMFRQWRADVKSHLKKTGNELYILFRSAVKHDDSLAALARPKLAGENTRMYSRKAQYQYGWDWGPRLVTCGIWKPVRWEAGNERPVFHAARSVRWNVQLVQKPDSLGSSFYFTRNGQPLFIKGANWIPCESFLPRAKKLQLYRKLIGEAKAAHVNMLRVWGGGVYEDDAFYDLCDKYGIMVWQDFMFAGALYPGDTAFRKNVEEELRYQVQRLRKHPCIVMWCGNNEIDEAWHNWGWLKQYGYSAADSARLWNDYRSIFHELIPRVLKELDPGRPYWPSSPSIGWGREQAYKQGDVHYWGVWWGREPVEKYKEKVGRFNSEYGMQGFPSMSTILSYARTNDLDTSSGVMKAHQKHPFGFANIAKYVADRFPLPKNFEDLVYVSQLMQADAIGTAIEAHRRNMPVTMGTLFWQWNDCWPVVSWSAVDYYGRKKALAWQLKRLFGTLLLTAEQRDGKLQVWVVSDSAKALEADLRVWYYDSTGQTRMGEPQLLRNIPVRPATANRFAFSLPDSNGPFPARSSIAYIRLQKGDKLLASCYFLPQYPKSMALPPAGLQWKRTGSNTLELRANAFAYGVCIEAGGEAEPDDNYFHMLPGEKRSIRFTGKGSPGEIFGRLRIRCLNDLVDP